MPCISCSPTTLSNIFLIPREQIIPKLLQLRSGEMACPEQAKRVEGLSGRSEPQRRRHKRSVQATRCLRPRNGDFLIAWQINFPKLLQLRSGEMAEWSKATVC
jgi:hypothetical protein